MRFVYRDSVHLSKLIHPSKVLDMLAETRAELDDFHQASKELEAELESELQRTEKAQQDLQAKVVRAEHERDEWKVHLPSTVSLDND